MMEPQGIFDHLKRILRHTAIYGLGFIGTSVLALVLAPLYTAHIAPDGYGRLRLINVTVQLALIFFSMGIVEAFYRFFYQFSDDARKKDIIATCLLLLLPPLLISGAILVLAAPQFSSWILESSAYADLFRVGGATLTVSGLMAYFLAYLRVEEKSAVYAVVSVLNLAVALGLNIFFVVSLKMGVMGVLLANLISATLVVLVTGPMLLKQVRLTIDREIAREVLRYGIPLVPALLAGFFISTSSLYFLKTYSTMAEVGIFSLALQFGSAIKLLVVTPFSMTWEPMKFKVVNDPQADRLYSNVLTYFVFIALMACAGLAVLIGDVMDLIINTRYQTAALYVGVIGLSYAIFGAYRVFSFGIDIKKKTHWRSIIIVASLGLNLLLNYFLIPPLGAWGAVASLIAAYGFMAIVSFITSQKLFPVSYQLGRLGKLCGMAAVHFVVGYQIETGSNLINLLLKTIVVLLFPLTLYFIRFYSEPEKQKLSQIIRQLFSRFSESTK